MEDRYVASMVLAGVGDAMGYRCGHWEFSFDGEQIHKECKALGGVEKLKIRKPDFIVSDDTVLLLSTAEAMIEVGTDKKKSEGKQPDTFYSVLAARYQNDFVKDMNSRAPGATTSASIHQLRPLRPNGWHIPFNPRGGGCGGAMRSMCIGLRYPNVFDASCLETLIAVSVESGRMTHNHPTGFLGSFASALFGALSICNVPLVKWGHALISLLPKVLVYIQQQGRDVKENEANWDYFQTRWKSYLELRNLTSGDSEPCFPEKYGVVERDAFYKSLSFSGWGGSSGHDAPMIAYDALLCARNNWFKLCHHGMLHSGDNDSSGVIAGFCFGAMYGFHEVPQCNYTKVEYHDRLKAAGKSLFTLATKAEYLKPSESTTIPIDRLFLS